MQKKFDLIPQIFSIDIEKRVDKDYIMKHNHYHNCYEIYYLSDGERYYFVKDRTYQIQKGDIILINKSEIHRSIQANSPYHERIVVLFKDEFIRNISDKNYDLLKSLQQEKKVLRLNLNQQIHLEELMNKMLKEYKELKKENYLYLKALLTEFLISLNRYIKNAEELAYPNSLHKQVSNYVKYINKNYHNSLKIEDISKKFAISPSYLSKIFKEVTNFTIIDYLNSVRIKEAQRLLSRSNLNISTIGERVGFNTLTHFGRIFKKKTGMSPSAFRK